MRMWQFEIAKLIKVVSVCLGLLSFIGCMDSNSYEDKVIIYEKPLSIQSPKVLIIFDSQDVYGIMCYQQTLKTLEYGKVPYEHYDLSSGHNLPELHGYSAIAITTEMLWKLNEQTSLKIKKYVEKGGGLAVLFRTWNEYLSQLFGVKNENEPSMIDGEEDFKIVWDFLPGTKDVCFYQEDISYFLVDLKDKVKIIASTKKNPIAWIHDFGKGKVIYWNTGLLARKINRGFITRSIAAVQPVSTVALANIGLFDIDDYPNSSSNQKIEPIKSEFDMTVSEFYTLQWYPDMLKLAKQFGLKYTSAVVFNYNGQISPPYNFFEWLHGEIKLGGKKKRSSLFAAQNLTDITELGLHGYNHQPLTLENWKTTENMKLALQEGRKRWEVDNLAALPFSYIPPLNIYDSTGINILQQEFPSIEGVGALYLGKFSEGQFREYGPEPWNKNLYVIPRNTSGYILTDFSKRSMISLLNATGIWAHFVHPDDVYPMGERYEEAELLEAGIDKIRWHGEPANKGLYHYMVDWLEFVKQHYPWLSYKTRKQAVGVMHYYDKIKIGMRKRGKILDLETNVIPSYFALFLRESNEMNNCIGCKVIHNYECEIGEHYIIRATDASMKIQLKNQIK
jgi:hypothetical protein